MGVTIKVDRTILDRIIANVADAKTKRHVIADGVEYGIYVELGTSRMSAQPFLVPSFEDGVKNLPKALGQAIERGVNPDDVLRKTAFDITGLAQRRAPVDTGALQNSLHYEAS